MAITPSRRNLLNVGVGAAATLGVLTVAGVLAPVAALAQGAPAATGSTQEPFYREDWFGEPWRTPEAAVLIYGNDESSIVWYAWVPRMAQAFRLLRPDLPGFGQSESPAGFRVVARQPGRFRGAGAGQGRRRVGAYYRRKNRRRHCDAVRGQIFLRARARWRLPAVRPRVIRVANRVSLIPQRDRLGSAAPKQMVDYWNAMFATAPEEGAKGLRTALSKFDLARDGVLQRIKAPTLVITADRSALQSVEKVRQYQQLIPNSRLVVLNSDAYHIAAANPDECVTNVLAFIKEARSKG